MVRLAFVLSALLFFPSVVRPDVLLEFPAEKVNFDAWMNAGGWQSKRDKPAGWSVSQGELMLVSAANSVLIGTEKGFPVDGGTAPMLRIKLKIKKVPRGTDLTRKAGDDAALRVYLTFDRGGGLIKPPNTLAYAWTEKDDAGTLIRSPYFPNLFYLSLGKGPTPANQWTVVERDLAADYRRAFPKEQGLPRLKALLLKCDSNDTKTSAEAALASIELVRKEIKK